MTGDEIYAKLSALPQPDFQKKTWPHYASLGFGKGEVEELLGLASDFYLSFEQSDEESAVSIHAWRALALMGDTDLAPEFVTLSMECDDIDDEWFAQDFPEIVGLLGMPALPTFLEAVANNPDYPDTICGVLEGIPKMVRNDEDRQQAMTVLGELLDRDDFDRDLRAMVVAALCDLKAQEKLAAIRTQFEANRINISIVGDLEEVEIELGVRTHRETPQPHLQEEEFRLAVEERKEMAGPFPKEGTREEQLQYFLIRYGSQRSLARVDQLDGFLLSLCISGIKFSNQERSILVWDPVEGSDEWTPTFESRKEKEIWLNALREHAREIEEGLAAGTYQPHVSVWPDAEQSMDPAAPYFSPWLDGFLTGEIAWGSDEELEESAENEVEKFGALTTEILESEDNGIRLLEDAVDNPVFALMSLIEKRYRNRSERSLPIRGGEQWFAPEVAGQSTPSQKPKKIERNDPCPCGSGRKYKKCCLN